jgi:dihydrofolate synthase/folylpolyglutamate synthase
MPNVKGQFQLENISTAIATLRTIKDFDIKDEHIKQGITKINSIARLQEIKSGKLKELAKDHQLFVDGSHNPLGAKVLNEYLESLNCNKHIILGMMANKDHKEYMSYFKDVKTLTTIDIPNQPNSIKGKELKDKLNSFQKYQLPRKYTGCYQVNSGQGKRYYPNYWIFISCWGSIEFKLDIFI